MIPTHLFTGLKYCKKPSLILILSVLFGVGYFLGERLLADDLAPKASLTFSENVESSFTMTREDFIQLQTDARSVPLALKTSILTFESPSQTGTLLPVVMPTSLRIDVIGAIHLVDQQYYEELNRLFRDYEVVLFEAVVPKGVELEYTKSEDIRQSPPPLLTSFNPETLLVALGTFQQSMASVLGLTFQINGIDYSQKNMKHCDFDMDALIQAIVEREPQVIAESISDTASWRETIASWIFDAVVPDRSLELQGGVALIFSRNRTLTLRRLVAMNLYDNFFLDGMGVGESSIITSRNDHVLECLEREIASGRRRIAIFYGCAHLPHLSEQLIERYQLRWTNTRWLTAWSLSFIK